MELLVLLLLSINRLCLIVDDWKTLVLWAKFIFAALDFYLGSYIWFNHSLNCFAIGCPLLVGLDYFLKYSNFATRLVIVIYSHFMIEVHWNSRPVLDEVEFESYRHVGYCCCWGSRPARTWKINAVENCNVYMGTIESFFEERDVKTEKEPYLGEEIDGKDEGPELRVWELDLRSEFLYFLYLIKKHEPSFLIRN